MFKILPNDLTFLRRKSTCGTSGLNQDLTYVLCSTAFPVILYISNMKIPHSICMQMQF
jgi:hypothetical protein